MVVMGYFIWLRLKMSFGKEHPLKAVQTNILGTLNLLKITVEEQNIKFILATSTDKAVQVSGTYGATKLLMENLLGILSK